MALAKFIEKKSGAFTKMGNPRPERTIPTFDDEPDVEEARGATKTIDEDPTSEVRAFFWLKCLSRRD